VKFYRNDLAGLQAIVALFSLIDYSFKIDRCLYGFI